MKSDYCDHCGTLFDTPESVSFGNVEIVAGELRCNGEKYHIAKQAHVMLRVLFRRKMISKEAWFAAVWGGDSDVEIKSVDVYLVRIRRFLREIGADFEIMTNWGTGYQLRLLSDPMPDRRHIHKSRGGRPAKVVEPTPTQDRKQESVRERLFQRRLRRQSYRR